MADIRDYFPSWFFEGEESSDQATTIFAHGLPLGGPTKQFTVRAVEHLTGKTLTFTAFELKGKPNWRRAISSAPRKTVNSFLYIITAPNKSEMLIRMNQVAAVYAVHGVVFICPQLKGAQIGITGLQVALFDEFEKGINFNSPIYQRLLKYQICKTLLNSQYFSPDQIYDKNSTFYSAFQKHYNLKIAEGGFYFCFNLGVLVLVTYKLMKIVYLIERHILDEIRFKFNSTDPYVLKRIQSRRSNFNILKKRMSNCKKFICQKTKLICSDIHSDVHSYLSEKYF